MDKKTLLKLKRINDLWLEVSQDNNLVKRFFDVDSEKMLDEKIRVLKELKSGKMPGDVKGFYEVLEKYPKDKNVKWAP